MQTLDVQWRGGLSPSRGPGGVLPAPWAMLRRFASRTSLGDMELTVLTVPDCPNGPLLEQRLRQALAGRDAVVLRREIADAAEAESSGMRGSPTLLVDGVDPFAAPGQPTSFACRVFRQPDGRVEGAPSVEQLRAVLSE